MNEVNKNFVDFCDENMWNWIYLFGIDSKTNFDLYKIAEILNLKIKVLMNNELDKINAESSNYILNYQNNDLPGTHWVALYISDSKAE